MTAKSMTYRICFLTLSPRLFRSDQNVYVGGYTARQYSPSHGHLAHSTHEHTTLTSPGSANTSNMARLNSHSGFVEQYMLSALSALVSEGYWRKRPTTRARTCMVRDIGYNPCINKLRVVRRASPMEYPLHWTGRCPPKRLFCGNHFFFPYGLIILGSRYVVDGRFVAISLRRPILVLILLSRPALR
jgi:hypothetical protein